MDELKFCKFCGEKIHFDAVICTKCGRQVEAIAKNDQPIIINNSANSSSSASSAAYAANHGHYGKRCNKWVAFLLCICLGYFGAHKFYEEKFGMGLLYAFTFGLFGIGWVFDSIGILFKPTTYYVN